MEAELFEKETREQYFNRLYKAIENIENGVNLVSFSDNEFEELTENLLGVSVKSQHF